MKKIYDTKTRQYIEVPEEIINFLNEIKNVCEKHNLSISHQDGHGSFEIERYSEDNIEWLCRANKNY